MTDIQPEGVHELDLQRMRFHTGERISFTHIEELCKIVGRLATMHTKEHGAVLDIYSTRIINGSNIVTEVKVREI